MPFKRRIKYLGLVLLGLLLVTWKLLLPLHLNLDSEELVELQKCPACFGVTFCPSLKSGEVVLDHWSRYTALRLVNVKNVFFGTLRSGRRVVLKKLGHDWELKSLDEEKICGHPTLKWSGEACNVGDTAHRLATLHSYSTLNKKLSLYGDRLGNGSELLACPSERKFEYILEKVIHNNKGQNKMLVLSNAITALLLNPEPLILQAFPHEEGWPFPQYYGACGRIIVEEFVGPSLATFYNTAWMQRANLAYQLLCIAEKLCDNDLNFNMYLTDVSADNFAVDLEGNVRIVDAEDIIIVDRNQVKSKKPNGWNSLHHSNGMGCIDCFSYSIDDLCNHEVSDHNFYAICQGLLAPGAYSGDRKNGFLHSIPAEVIDLYPELPHLLSECGQSKEAGGRITAAKGLKRILSKLIQ